MEKNKTIFDNFNYGDALVQGLQQALEYAKGDKSRCRVTVRETPVPEYNASDGAIQKSKIAKKVIVIMTFLAILLLTVLSA